MPGKPMDSRYRQARRAAVWASRSAWVWESPSSPGAGSAIPSHSFPTRSTPSATPSPPPPSGGRCCRRSGRPTANTPTATLGPRPSPGRTSHAARAVGVGIAWEIVATWGEPSPPPEAYTLVIAAVSVVLKEGLYRYESGVARATGSGAMRAAAWDHRLDALGSLAVLAGLALFYWGGPAWHAADHVAALAVAGAVLSSGGGLLWGSVQELMDRQAEPEVLEEVRREASAVSGVLGVEKLLVRKTGPEYVVDIHVEVNPEASVREGHGVGHAVKDRLMGASPRSRTCWFTSSRVRSPASGRCEPADEGFIGRLASAARLGSAGRRRARSRSAILPRLASRSRWTGRFGRAAARAVKRSRLLRWLARGR